MRTGGIVCARPPPAGARGGAGCPNLLQRPGSSRSVEKETLIFRASSRRRFRRGAPLQQIRTRLRPGLSQDPHTPHRAPASRSHPLPGAHLLLGQLVEEAVRQSVTAESEFALTGVGRNQVRDRPRSPGDGDRGAALHLRRQRGQVRLGLLNLHRSHAVDDSSSDFGWSTALVDPAAERAGRAGPMRCRRLRLRRRSVRPRPRRSGGAVIRGCRWPRRRRAGRIGPRPRPAASRPRGGPR